MRVLGVAMAALFLFSGCVVQEKGAVAAAEDVEAAVHRQIELLIACDVEPFLDTIAHDWVVDLGGGDGTPFTREERRQKMKEFCASQEYQDKVRGRSVEDLFQWDEFTTKTYAQHNKEKFFGSSRFQPRPQDVWAMVPPGPQGLHDDGWGGFYRPVGDAWIQVAGD